ncbi:hypothetical protein PTKIN_Ptkin07bG0246300 [Pterospermum kingtungense]
MDRSAKYSKAADILDLSLLSSADDSRIDVSENHLRSQIRKQRNYQGAAMSEEEWKIRGELESDIERDLEEEIKDGIYHLALRLHRLYQHRRERNALDISESGDHKKDKALSQVIISIKMEGGTKIEIKETKKETPADDRQKGLHLPPRSTRPTHVKAWSDQAKIPGNDRGLCMNLNLENTRKNMVSASGQRKGNIGLNNKVPEVGWKW